jgi:hypothetical protein
MERYPALPNVGDVIQWIDPETKNTLQGRVQICDPNAMLCSFWGETGVGGFKWVHYENVLIQKERREVVKGWTKVETKTETETKP